MLVAWCPDSRFPRRDPNVGARFRSTAREPLGVDVAMAGLVSSGCQPAGTTTPVDADLVTYNEVLGDPYGGRFPLNEALAEMHLSVQATRMRRAS